MQQNNESITTEMNRLKAEIYDMNRSFKEQMKQRDALLNEIASRVKVETADDHSFQVSTLMTRIDALVKSEDELTKLQKKPPTKTAGKQSGK